MPENLTHKNYSPENHPPDHGASAPDRPARRRRYARSPSQAVLTPLTPTRVEMLRFLADLRFLSLPQIARLCCPSSRQDLAEKSARRHMRALFDTGLVDVLPVSRAALAPPGTPNGTSLLYGSAPNVYAPTARGLAALVRAGLIGKEEGGRSVPTYGPRNSLFLAHELAVRDVRVWLEGAARSGRHEIERWYDGGAAAIELPERQPIRFVRPDCWFVYRMDQVVLVGLVEVDRGTERGDRRWQEKIGAYETLCSGGALRAATGYVNARILVVAPNGKRRDQLAEFILTAGSRVASRFWITEHTELRVPSLVLPVWRYAGDFTMRPLV